MTNKEIEEEFKEWVERKNMRYLLEVWEKDGKQIIVKCHPKCEWRYEIRDGTTWISGMCLYSLIEKGWKQLY